MYTDSGPWTVVRVRGGGTVTPVVVPLQSVATELAEGAAKMAGLALLAAGLAAVVAMVHWWYVRERVPGGLPVLVGLSGVAVAIGTTGALRQVREPGRRHARRRRRGVNRIGGDGGRRRGRRRGGVGPGERGDGDRDGGDDASGERS
jgi:hypothetical protein